MSIDRAALKEKLKTLSEEGLSCGITEQIFLKPVVTIPGGHSIEEDKALVLLHNGTPYPSAGNEFTRIIPNMLLQRIADTYLNLYPDADRYGDQQNQKGNINKDYLKELEDELKCPLTGRLFVKPVLLVPSGHTIEESKAKELMNSGGTYPAGGRKIESYVPNIELQRLVDAYLKINPAAKINQVSSPSSPIVNEEKKQKFVEQKTEYNDFEQKNEVLTAMPCVVGVLPDAIIKSSNTPSSVFLLGRAGSGKEEFLACAADNASQNTSKILGVNFKMIEINKTRYQLWDIKTATSAYLSKANIVLLFAENAAEAEHWVKEVAKAIPNMKFFTPTYQINNIKTDVSLEPHDQAYLETLFESKYDFAKIPAVKIKESVNLLLANIIAAGLNANNAVPKAKKEGSPKGNEPPKNDSGSCSIM